MKQKPKLLREANENSRQKHVNCLMRSKNISGHVITGFSFNSDWLRECCEIFGPVSERSEAKLKQSKMIFDTQLQFALITKQWNTWCSVGVQLPNSFWPSVWFSSCSSNSWVSVCSTFFCRFSSSVFYKRKRSMSLNAMANKALLGPVNFIYCRSDKPSFNTGVL